MKKILMMRSNKAYLPQIDATINYFNSKNLGFTLHDSAEIDAFTLRDFDVIWRFTGMDVQLNKTIPTIHEYTSLSTGIFPQFKNTIKRSLNRKPDLRIFLNQFVQDGMDFTDGIESLQRDMGVDDLFFRYQECIKQYDCVYVGSISKARGIHRLLHHFKEQQDKRSLLMIGSVPDDIHQEYGRVDNITFTGNVPYADVPKYASQAVYGINYMPNKYPFNLQTSTKLLEYLAMNLKIITTNYEWIQHFMNKHQMKFITVDQSLEGLEKCMNNSEPQELNKDVVSSFNWTNVIGRSGIEKKLIELI